MERAIASFTQRIRKGEPTVDYHIDWSKPAFTSELLALVKERSQTKPLREIIADIMLSQTEVLYQTAGITKVDRYNDNYVSRSKDLRLAAIRGYGAIPQELLSMSMMFLDGQAAAKVHERQFAYKALGMIDNDMRGADQALNEHGRFMDTVDERLDFADETFVVDSRGFDLLDNYLGYLRFRKGLFKHAVEKAEYDGAYQAVQQYKAMYKEAVRLGASPDRKGSLIKGGVLRAKRGIEFAGSIPSAGILLGALAALELYEKVQTRRTKRKSG